MLTNRRWKENYGFLAVEKAAESFLSNSTQGCCTTLSLGLRDSKRRDVFMERDSVDGFVHEFLVKKYAGSSIRYVGPQHYCDSGGGICLLTLPIASILEIIQQCSEKKMYAC
jgi:hypothetical protein